VEWLTLLGERDAWRSLGLVVGDDGLIPLMGTSLSVEAQPDESSSLGIVEWSLSGIEESASVDGLVTKAVEPQDPAIALHPLGASGLDHVVVMTPDLLRTSDAITAATGHELKRVREVGTMKQGFHRIGRGGLIVEIVERPEIPDGPATFWGLVLNVDDLDAACALLGEDKITPPKDAVQPGRRIATVREEVGLGLPLALMTS
jgi:hypothetical protein